MKNLLITLILLLLASPFTHAADITKEKGYVSFGNLESEYGEPKVLINLNQAMLGFVSKMSESDDETAQLIRKLKAVRVQIYNIDEDAQPALNLVEKVTNEIKNKSWMPIVSINEEHEKVRIFTKLTDDIMDGLVVMIINDGVHNKEAVFINIIGEIDPAQINKVTDALDIKTGL